jgi:DNA (cytosine-5)-methyltransferase 1
MVGFWESEPGVGMLDHGVPERVAKLKALGNAVVPQVVEIIGRYIMQFEKEKNADNK